MPVNSSFAGLQVLPVFNLRAPLIHRNLKGETAVDAGTRSGPPGKDLQQLRGHGKSVVLGVPSCARLYHSGFRHGLSSSL